MSDFACYPSPALLSPSFPQPGIHHGTRSDECTQAVYFLVHPRPVWQAPKAQHLNEKNLKTLKNYVDTLVIDRKRPNQRRLLFIKPRLQEEKERAILRSVGIRLKDSSIRGPLVTIKAGRPASTDTSTTLQRPPPTNQRNQFDWFDSEMSKLIQLKFSQVPPQTPGSPSRPGSTLTSSRPEIALLNVNQ